MVELYTLGMIAGVVAVLAVVLYVWDRTTKGEPIDLMDVGKFAIGAGGVAGGVAYAVGSDDAIQVVTNVATQAQEMFIGKPEF
jgi:hypothetical protein